MGKPFWKVLTVILLVLVALYFCLTDEMMFGLLIYFVLPFPMRPSYLMLLFWAITIGLVIAYILWKKNIGSNRWRWVVLFAMEILGLICANVESRWGSVPPKSGWFNLGLADCEVARRGVVFFALQLIATLIVFFYFRKNKCQQPPKPPKREFCGDV